MVAEKDAPTTNSLTLEARIPVWAIDRLSSKKACQPLSVPAMKAVYVDLWRHADFETGKCYPTVKTIQERNGLSRRTVGLAFRRLTALGLIQIHRVNGRKNVFWVRRYPAKTSAERDTSAEREPLPGALTAPNQRRERTPNKRHELAPITSTTVAAVEKPSKKGQEASARSEARALFEWWRSKPGRTGTMAQAERVAAYPTWMVKDHSQRETWIGNLGKLADSMHESPCCNTIAETEAVQRAITAEAEQRAAVEDLRKKHLNGEKVTAEQWAAVGVEDPPAKINRQKSQYRTIAQELRLGATGNGGKTDGDQARDVEGGKESTSGETAANDVRADNRTPVAVGGA